MRLKINVCPYLRTTYLMVIYEHTYFTLDKKKVFYQMTCHLLYEYNVHVRSENFPIYILNNSVSSSRLVINEVLQDGKKTPFNMSYTI